MTIQDHFRIGPKTTMRIGGTVRYYAMLETKADAEEAMAFAKKKNVPLMALGAGSNTVFADGEVQALIVQIKPSKAVIENNTVRVSCGNNLPMLLNELAPLNLDLSALTGIPGTVGGAIVGNAGQGPKGIWIDTYVKEVTALIDGKWQTISKSECQFGYRESRFKHESKPAIVWEAVLEVPHKPAAEIQATIQSLLQKRIETQPHMRTAGSCFKAVGDVPAWKLIDAAGLRGAKFGDIQIAEKHANFLLNTGKASYDDAKKTVETVRRTVTSPLDVEMRFIEPDGSLAF